MMPDKSHAPVFIQHKGVTVYRVPRHDFDAHHVFRYSLHPDRNSVSEDHDFDVRWLPGGEGLSFTSHPTQIASVITTAIDNGALENYTVARRGHFSE